MKKTKLEAEASIYLDENRPKKNGNCSVKIKVTFNRKRKYFATGRELSVNEFEQTFFGRRKTAEQKEVKIFVEALLNKANDIIKKLNTFTFQIFEENYLEERNIQNSVSFAFDKYIKQLKFEERIGTAVSYECARNSLQNFNKNLVFAEITVSTLKKYENWMLQNNKSKTTIGIYLRSLRTIYNQQNIDKSIYPFGNGQNKYSIPAGRNIKKALTLDEIISIYEYEAEPNSTKEMAKDYWLFLYLCNGMNVKDFCLLKWSNIDEQTITYERAKTQRSNKEEKKISIALKPQTWDIIKKWGQPSISKDAYIFPHLKAGMTAEKERTIYQGLTKLINKYIKQITSEIGINKNVTTYFARHSFATVLKRSGSNSEVIKELLGHSSLKVTDSYLDSFEMDHIQKETDALTAGFKQAN